MNIREFLFYENLSVAEFAEKARLSRGYMDMIINAGLKPSKKACEDLKKATHGKVAIPEGLYAPRPRKKRKGLPSQALISVLVTE